MNHNEEGLVFRRHRDWLEGLIGAGFTNKSNCSSAASLSINDAKLVGPTARDRIVQISGQTPANISVAKNLIDATIKQNASPIAFSEIGETGEFINSNHPPQSGDPYSAHDHATNKYNSAIQSSALNSLCEGGDPAGHSIKVKLQDKEACIIVSDKLLGEKLEQFLSKFNFVDFIKSSQSEEKMKSGVARSTHDPKPHNKYERNSFMRCNPAANVESVKPNLGANCEPVAPSVAPPSSSGPDKPKPHITYDRDFLLKFKTITHYTASRVIEDIKMKQGHLFRC